jgi:hypothetical protein
MTLNFCTRTARKLRRFGYARKVAARYARFFYVSMISVCGLFGLLDGMPEVLNWMGIGSGKSSADPRAASLLSADFGLRRR